MFTVNSTRFLPLLILAVSTAVHAADFTPVNLHGKISCSWKLEGNQFQTEFTIPPNTEAVVTLPIDGPGGDPKHLGSGTHKVSGKYLTR